MEVVFQIPYNFLITTSFFKTTTVITFNIQNLRKTPRFRQTNSQHQIIFLDGLFINCAKNRRFRSYQKRRLFIQLFCRCFFATRYIGTIIGIIESRNELSQVCSVYIRATAVFYIVDLNAGSPVWIVQISATNPAKIG